jgi:DNA-directed RNA polymerase specialized sigma24 family protein
VTGCRLWREAEKRALRLFKEVFARALSARKQFRGKGSLAGWMWRIALRIASESRRRSSRVGERGFHDPQTLGNP